MKISVTGKQMDVGASLREHVESSIDARVNKYFDRAIDADVVFFKEAHLFAVDIVVNEGTGKNMVIRGQGRSEDVYACFDLAAERIEKQLRRYKRRLKNHRATDTTAAVAEISKHIIETAHAEAEVEKDPTPLIVAEKKIGLQTLSVSDAVMHMDLAHLPALMFINSKSGSVDVVYHREDGNISWVESECAAASIASIAAA